MTEATQSIYASLLWLAVSAPAGAAALLGGAGWLGTAVSERAIARTVAVAFSSATACCAALLAAWLLGGTETLTVTWPAWTGLGPVLGSQALVGDGLSLPFALLSTSLVGLIGAFSRRYLHLEPGFHRFYMLLSVFGVGASLVALAGGLELALVGWELLGISSALLIAYFNERPRPVEHGVLAFAHYRICDVGLIVAIVWLHLHGASGAFAPRADGFAGIVAPGSMSVLVLALAVVWASLAKSAQLPLGSWLPRAMEGPTPSSAIFYGAVSVHMGAYLLMRAAPVLEREPIASALVVVIGASTAVYGTVVGRAQTDIKSVLAYASMSQVGLVFVEIGLGQAQLALLHMLGHAAVRSLQILRSPSLLHDRHHLEQAMGQQLPRSGGHLERLIPRHLEARLYRLALERGGLDTVVVDGVAARVVSAVGALHRIDRTVLAWLSGTDQHTQQTARASLASVEDPA